MNVEEIKNYIEKIITSADEKKFKEMTEYVECLLEKIDRNDVEEMERWLYEISEGKILNEQRAGELISAMKPFGKKWELADTEGVRNSMGAEYADIRPVDFWIVMNSAYNDYNDLFKEDVSLYARYAKDFIKDEDAVEDKIYYYYSMIPKKGD